LKNKDNKYLESVLNETYPFEYGDDIVLKHDDFELKYDTSALENEDGYVAVGKHTVKVSFDFKKKEIQKDVKIVVSDNLGPKFTKFKDTFEVYENEEIKDIASNFKAKDLTKVKIDFDLDTVKFKEKGNYKAKAIAKDAHGNQTIKSFSVVVKEKPQPKPEPTPQAPSTPSTPSSTPSSSKYPVAKNATYRGGHVIVNKKHGIPPNFASGENPEAVSNLRSLISEMKSQGMRVAGDWAGYRTYEHQEILYTRYIREHGQAAADISSAVPGFSEHQTGLAFDLRSPSGVLLQTQPEIGWVKDNAHRFGFIIRYPEGKTHITGYKYEPWHLRYLGNDAVKLYEANQTLEEYFNIEG
ncbi:MAG TPA: M15 family metallopeptidase, partial [Erysipelothrix sp.]|nr:M15 family metallopeptidase [Erysipelothrix sp.]